MGYKTESSKSGIKKAGAEGVGSGNLGEIHSTIRDSLSTFMQMFVLEVISDPKKITPEKIEYWKKVFKLSFSPTINFEDGNEFNPRVFPRNTIIAQRKSVGNSGIISSPMFLLPFFPSHMALPCKPGELVWAVYENPYAGSREIAYWMCSVVQPHFVDDVNHSFMPAGLRSPKIDPNLLPLQFSNGKTYLVSQNGNNVIKTDQKSKLINDERADIFERIALGEINDAGNLMQYEKIPRFHKRPADVAIEGSNNSLIVLGTERYSAMADYELLAATNTTEGAAKLQNISRGLVPQKTELDFVNEAGTIDMVTGRGYLPDTGGTSIPVVGISINEPVKEELNKLSPPPFEGDPDFINDRSRILISQRTSVDSRFNLSQYFTQKAEDVEDSETGDAGIVIKSDKIRLIARSDVSLIVTSYNDVDDETELKEKGIKFPYKNETPDIKRWASITITSEGDIIFTPSELGLIKLGGEDADKAILCTDNLAPGAAGKPTVSEGKVTFKPGIVSTGADLIGTGKPKQGTFATKILVK